MTDLKVEDVDGKDERDSDAGSQPADLPRRKSLEVGKSRVLEHDIPPLISSADVEAATLATPSSPSKPSQSNLDHHVPEDLRPDLQSHLQQVAAISPASSRTSSKSFD